MKGQDRWPLIFLSFIFLSFAFTFSPVNSPLPFVTVIIPTRPGQTVIPAVNAARALDYPKDRIEIIVARGRQPSIQRNAAIKEARGELIYFLDDDSCAQSSNLRRAIEHFNDPFVKMVGGPNLCPPDAPLLEQVFAVVLGSWLATMSSRARYASVGAVRTCSEKELILCNLAVRRADLLELGGFDEALYPNEENALMDQLQKRGGKLIYDPEFIVQRRPRPTLRAFIKMLMTYGRGRAEQFRLHPTPGSALNFVPPLFCLYLVIGPWFGWIGLLPLAAYVIALLGQALVSAKDHGLLKSLLALPLVMLTHIFYGLGFWRGLFTKLQRTRANPIDVSLERIAL
jgi:succinoglycan biosynthesis protein ExoA